MSDAIFIFWEPQDAALCGLHALNTLIQETTFHPNDLADIARDLDDSERSLMSESSKVWGTSGNVDESGNFSIQVLRAAVKRSHNIDLISWTGTEGKLTVDVTKEQGFIINRSSHWFAIRRINGRFWNLNSTLEQGPELISPFYLSAFLAGLCNDGYSVFLAKGKLPPGGTKPFGVSSNSTSKWFTEKELLSKAGPGAATEKAAFSWDEAGPGRRLTEKMGSSYSTSSNGTSTSFGAGGMDIDSDDFLLAQALSASMNDVNPGSSGSGGGSSGMGSSTAARQQSGADLRPYMDNIQAFDDPDLALALALSKQDSATLSRQSSIGTSSNPNNTSNSGSQTTSHADSSGTLTKEQIRQKRLEAFNKTSGNS